MTNELKNKYILVAGKNHDGICMQVSFSELLSITFPPGTNSDIVPKTLIQCGCCGHLSEKEWEAGHDPKTGTD